MSWFLVMAQNHKVIIELLFFLISSNQLESSIFNNRGKRYLQTGGHVFVRNMPKKKTNYVCLSKAMTQHFAAGCFSRNWRQTEIKEAPETLFDDDALEFPATTTRLFFHLTWVKTLVSTENDTLLLEKFNEVKMVALPNCGLLMVEMTGFRHHFQDSTGLNLD